MAWLYKRKESDNWEVGYRFNGQQFRATTGTSDRAAAERELSRIRALYEAHKAGSVSEKFFDLLSGRQPQKHTLISTVDLWHADCKELSSDTQLRYRQILQDFCTAINATPESPLIKDVSSEIVSEYLRKKREQTSRATAKLALTILGAFFSFAKANKRIAESPVPSAKTLKLVKRSADTEVKRRAFTHDELARIFQACPDEFWEYMVLAGLAIGQRMGDLIQITWGQVDFKSNAIKLRQGKTGKMIHAPMHPVLIHFLQLKKEKTKDAKSIDPIWPEQAERYRIHKAKVFSNQFYDRVMAVAGLVPKRSHHKAKRGKDSAREISNISFHSLRHTFVSLAYSAGASQATVKAVAGHASEAMSDHYTHISADVLAKELKLLPIVGKTINEAPQ